MLLTAMREIGSQLAVYSYAYDEVVNEDDDSGLVAFVENITFSELFVRNQVEDLVGADYLENSPLTNGKKGLVFYETSILQQNDIIDLVVLYRASPFIELVGFLESGFYTRYYGRAWTGYNVDQAENIHFDTMVYVTENGTVYHTQRKCTYIDLSVKEVSVYGINKLHNEYGESYSACEYCANQNLGTTCYITRCGCSYHMNKHCNALSRYIFQIPYNEAKLKYRACPRCGR